MCKAGVFRTGPIQLIVLTHIANKFDIYISRRNQQSDTNQLCEVNEVTPGGSILFSCTRVKLLSSPRGDTSFTLVPPVFASKSHQHSPLVGGTE